MKDDQTMTPQPFSITVYGLPDSMCFGCRKTKELLDAADVPFRFVDLSLEEHAGDREALRELGHMRAPYVLLSDGTEWTGLQPDQIEDAIAKHRRSLLAVAS